MKATVAYPVLFRDSARPHSVTIYPQLVKLLGGINEAVFFHNLVQWSDAGDRAMWICKTAAEIEQETSLTTRQLARARRHLRELGVLEDRYAKWEYRFYFRVNFDGVARLLSRIPKRRSGPSPEDRNGIQARKPKRYSPEDPNGTQKFLRVNSQSNKEASLVRDAGGSQKTTPRSQQHSAVKRKAKKIRPEVQRFRDLWTQFYQQVCKQLCEERNLPSTSQVLSLLQHHTEAKLVDLAKLFFTTADPFIAARREPYSAYEFSKVMRRLKALRNGHGEEVTLQ